MHERYPTRLTAAIHRALHRIADQLSTPLQRPLNPSRRKFTRAVGIAAAASVLAACAPTRVVTITDPDQTRTAPPAPIPTTTGEPSPTPTPELPPLIAHAPDAPYPSSDTGFVINAGGEEDTEEKLLSLSGEEGSPTREQLKADLDWMKKANNDQLIAQGLNPANFEFKTKINQTEEGFFWTLMVQEKGGSIYIPKITSGTDAGQLIRKGDLTLLIGSDISFELIPIVEAGEGSEQRIIADESGWFVVGAFDSKGQAIGWFNVEKDSWQPLSSFKAQGASETVFNSEKNVWEGKDAEGKIVAIYDATKAEWEYQLIDTGTGWEYKPEELLGGDEITINPDTALLQQKFEEWLKGLYHLNILVEQEERNPYLQNTYGITNEQGFIDYAKSGKPLTGLVLMEPWRDTTGPRRDGAIPKRSQEAIDLSKVRIRVLHRDELNSTYPSQDSKENKAIYFQYSEGYFVVFQELATNTSGLKEIQLAFASYKQTNFIRDGNVLLRPIDASSDPDNLKAVNQNLFIFLHYINMVPIDQYTGQPMVFDFAKANADILMIAEKSQTDDPLFVKIP